LSVEVLRFRTLEDVGGTSETLGETLGEIAGIEAARGGWEVSGTIWSVKARFVRYPSDDATLAIDAQEVETFALPEEGSVYWWRDPYRVRRVTPGDPPTVELVLDQERDHRYRSDLLPGWTLEAGRGSDTEYWHATVFGPGGDIRGHVPFCETGDEAVERARVDAGLPATAPLTP
jgi:hypothetical protein